MKKTLSIFSIVCFLMSCGSGSKSSAGSDTTTNSISPPPTSDTSSTVAPMMGDTSKTEADSLKK
ncbi:MAG TPA: hypothetical protein VH396_07925 [Chitinophagaceae bacterium]